MTIVSEISNGKKAIEHFKNMQCGNYKKSPRNLKDRANVPEATFFLVPDALAALTDDPRPLPRSRLLIAGAMSARPAEGATTRALVPRVVEPDRARRVFGWESGAGIPAADFAVSTRSTAVRYSVSAMRPASFCDGARSSSKHSMNSSMLPRCVGSGDADTAATAGRIGGFTAEPRLLRFDDIAGSKWIVLTDKHYGKDTRENHTNIKFCVLFTHVLAATVNQLRKEFPTSAPHLTSP